VSGHTPGPWTIQGAFIGTDDAHIAQIKGEGRGVNPQRAEANSMLIAAAPDLLAALVNLRDFTVMSNTRQVEYLDAGNKHPAEVAQAAIAKATGACHAN
jgi:hypothetical protein